MKNRLKSCCPRIALGVLLLPAALAAQTNVLTVNPPPKLTAKKNTTLTAKVAVQLRNGYHVNSNTPSEEYLIPLRLSWTAAPLEVSAVKYPTPKMEKYEFAEKPLSVFTGDFDLITEFRVPASAKQGLHLISGKVRYQACTHTECLPPRTVEVKLPIEVVP